MRREDDVDALLFRDREVAGLVARVGREIGRLVELGRVDEEGHDNAVVFAAGGREERPMAGVECAHGRYQAGPRRVLELGDGADDPHAIAAVASASVA